MSVFTDYVRALARRGEPPDERELASLFHALRSALRSELRRRGLWERPPSYLGLVGWQSWDRAAGGEQSALDDLAVECYTFIFVDRLRSLQAQLRVKPDIEGLIVLDVRHFVHERQRQHDPLGFRVFEILRAAVRGALERGELHVLDGDPRVRNETVLGFGPGGEPPPRPAPDLVTARGKRQDELVEGLRRRLPELRGEGFRSFRFSVLLDPLKNDARSRWAALLGQAAGDVVPDEGAGAARSAQPDTGAEERESFDRLVRQVDESLRRLPTDERTRGYLASLWAHLSGQASDPADLAAPDRLSQRKMAGQLGIPRERVPELLATLGRMVEECRATGPGRAR
jgi:hypothetical protein